MRSSQLRWAHLSRWIGNSLSYSGNARPVKKSRLREEEKNQDLRKEKKEREKEKENKEERENIIV
jgi:hypothetical protein